MRIVLSTLTASAVFGLSVLSHAETVDFTYTPTGASAVTFSLNPAQIYSDDLNEDVVYSNVALSNGDTAKIYFENPTLTAAIGDGSVNLLSDDLGTATSIVYTGVQLYSGPEDHRLLPQVNIPFLRLQSLVARQPARLGLATRHPLCLPPQSLRV